MNETRIRLEQRHPITIFLSFFLAIASGISLIGYLFIITGTKNISLEQQSLIDTLAWPEIGLTLLINATIFIAALALYLHRRFALYFFLAAVAADLGKLLLIAFEKGSLAAVFSAGMGGEGLLLLLGILLATCAYTWRLYRIGKLD